MLQIICEIEDQNIDIKNNQISKLSLIDLAGSERASTSSNIGIRMKEGAMINKSLLALSNCINMLYENSKN
jgi:kinesin family protein 18/19